MPESSPGQHRRFTKTKRISWWASKCRKIAKSKPEVDLLLLFPHYSSYFVFSFLSKLEPKQILEIRPKNSNFSYLPIPLYLVIFYREIHAIFFSIFTKLLTLQTHLFSREKFLCIQNLSSKFQKKKSKKNITKTTNIRWMNCHVYLSARKKVKKKIKKKFLKKYHSKNLFINRNFFPQKSFETKNPSKNLITAKTKFSFSSPYNLDIYTLKITYPIRTFF